MTYRAPDDEIAAYHQAGWWTDTTLSDRIAELAATKPEAPAFIVLPAGATEPYTTTWREYDALVTSVASALIAAGLEAGDRVAVLMPDRIEVHATLVGINRAGLVAVGLGHRRGRRRSCTSSTSRALEPWPPPRRRAASPQPSSSRPSAPRRDRSTTTSS